MTASATALAANLASTSDFSSKEPSQGLSLANVVPQSEAAYSGRDSAPCVSSPAVRSMTANRR